MCFRLAETVRVGGLGIPGWFGTEGTLNPIPSTPSTVPGCPKPCPTWDISRGSLDNLGCKGVCCAPSPPLEGVTAGIVLGMLKENDNSGLQMQSIKFDL